MRFGLLVVELQSTNGCIADFRVRFKRWHVSVGQPQPRFRDSSPRLTKFGVLLQRLPEKFEALAQFGLGVLVRIKEALQIGIVCIRAPSWTQRRDRKFELQSIDNGTRDFIL